MSARVPGQELQCVRDDLDRYKEFARLCEEFAQATELLGQRERAVSEEAKKRRKPLRKSRAK